MLRTNYRCVQSPNISVDVAKCLEKFHKFTQHTLIICNKNVLVLTEQYIHGKVRVKFQLIKMSYYAKHKLQMCTVTQH